MKKRHAPKITSINLSPEELGLLLQCPYDHPKVVEEPFATVALVLVALGLLEQNPDTENLFRVTPRGLEQLRLRWALHEGT